MTSFNITKYAVDNIFVGAKKLTLGYSGWRPSIEDEDSRRWRPPIRDNYLTGTAGNDYLSGGYGDDKLYGLAGNDRLDGWEGNDILEGGDGNDYLLGGNGNDKLNGGDGEDILYGDYNNDLLIVGNDTLKGGKGNDQLLGGAGNDTYLFNIDDGSDTIIESSGTDKLVLGNGLLASDTTIQKINGNDLLIKFSPSDQVIISGWSSYLHNSVETIQFADNTEWSFDSIENTLKKLSDISTQTNKVLNLSSWTGKLEVNGGAGADNLTTGSGNDVISSGAGDDNLDGGDGNDSLDGYYGNDTLIGGKGNDQLLGGPGDDIYLFNIGDGSDTIIESSGTNKLILGSDLLASDTTIQIIEEFYLLIKFSASDQVIIYDWPCYFHNSVETIQFADNTQWSVDSIQNTLKKLSGLSTQTNKVLNLSSWTGKLEVMGGAGEDNLTTGFGNDVISGGEGNDSLNGGAGNDSLNGGAGNDSYQFNKGDGLDIITDTSGTDKLILGSSLLAADTAIQKINSTDLLFKFSATDQVTIKNWFISSNNYLETIQFADNTVWNAETINSTLNSLTSLSTQTNKVLNLTDWTGKLEVTGGSESDNLTTGSGNDVISGGAGDDSLNGGIGNDILNGDYGLDVLNGGAGDDTLNGDAGNDILNGGSGSDTLNGGDGNDNLNGGDASDYLNGGAGNDIYQFGIGVGHDTITDYETAANKDQLLVGAGVNYNQFWFSHLTDTADLEVTILGQRAKAVIKNWYSGSANQIEEIKLADGKVLANTDVEKLVQAMAVFSPPPAYLTSLPASYATELNPILAANWK